MASTRICLGVAVALAVLLVGCGPEEAAPEVIPSGETASATSADDASGGVSKQSGAPSNEGEAGPGDVPGKDSGDDKLGSSDSIAPGPDKPTEEAPALSLPRLPIGGDASEPDAAGVQCAEVNWLGTPGSAADLTPGIHVKVTDVEFSPSIFTVGGEGCGGLPPCTGFVYQVGADRCSVAVAARAGAGDPGGPYFFTLTGTIDCTTLGKQRCATFAQAVAGEQDQSISLSAPISTNETDNSDVPAPGTDGDGQSGSGDVAAGTSGGTSKGETGSTGDTPSDSGTGEETPPSVSSPAE